MSTISVTPVQQNNHIIYIDNATNAPYFNLAQAEIIFPNVESRTLRRRLQLVAKSEVKNARIPTTNGIKLVALYDVEVLANLAFEFDLALAKLMLKAGATVFLYGLVGFEIKPQPKTDICPFNWITTRDEGKDQRSKLAKTIDRLIEYGKAQGAGEGIKNYYATITTQCININVLIDSQFADSKIKDKRDRMDESTLNNVKTLEEILSRLIDGGMEDNLHYKEIYKLCKTKMYQYSHELKIKPAKLLEVSLKKEITSQKQFSLFSV